MDKVNYWDRIPSVKVVMVAKEFDMETEHAERVKE